ncbi:hypothetical protein HMPREF1545_01377 [Oscillibacter sp. KLE 1728]|nr:hypothetical protein HMPREF1545_01377 [Oscillibacter sp. KLE 1728]ERK64924.1 hypothetical protein HMPREF1546_01515 [Oscillibacter sp. KLE 1745]
MRTVLVRVKKIFLKKFSSLLKMEKRPSGPSWEPDGRKRAA